MATALSSRLSGQIWRMIAADWAGAKIRGGGGGVTFGLGLVVGVTRFGLVVVGAPRFALTVVGARFFPLALMSAPAALVVVVPLAFDVPVACRSEEPLELPL